MADEVTLETIAENQQAIIAALGTLATKLDALATAVGKVETATDGVKNSVLHRHW